MIALWCNDHIRGRDIKFHLITDPGVHLIDGGRL